MIIRQAHAADLDDLAPVYEGARRIMRESGNPTQWEGGYPGRELVAEDIERGEFFVVEEDGAIHGGFMFSTEPDPTYDVIEDGAWLDDAPYGVVHRIASDGQLHGVMPAVLSFCEGFVDNLRIDTHEDNAIMQHILEREGFVRCGIIYCHDGSPRIAYQRHR